MWPVMRLGLDERAVTELLGVTEHCRGLKKVAAALLLEDDEGSEKTLLPEPTEAETSRETQQLLRTIGDREAARLGRPGVPKIWRAICRNFYYLEATWAKHEHLMRETEIDAQSKLAVGLGVSANNNCRYFVRYFAAAIIQAGWDSERILEIIGVVDHYNSLNTIASGMQIYSDIRPPGAG
jgi:alkylhydroperoxidase/carboxymuconolactone decarboxylase family protein YurZ